MNITGAPGPYKIKYLAKPAPRIFALIVVVVLCGDAVQCMVAVSAPLISVYDVNVGNTFRTLNGVVITQAVIFSIRSIIFGVAEARQRVLRSRNLLLFLVACGRRTHSFDGCKRDISDIPFCRGGSFSVARIFGVIDIYAISAAYMADM